MRDERERQREERDERQRDLGVLLFFLPFFVLVSQSVLVFWGFLIRKRENKNDAHEYFIASA
jgi:hypothetical protein